MIFKILARSWQESKKPLKMLARKENILKDLGKKTKTLEDVCNGEAWLKADYPGENI